MQDMTGQQFLHLYEESAIEVITSKRFNWQPGLLVRSVYREWSVGVVVLTNIDYVIVNFRYIGLNFVPRDSADNGCLYPALDRKECVDMLVGMLDQRKTNPVQVLRTHFSVAPRMDSKTHKVVRHLDVDNPVFEGPRLQCVVEAFKLR